MNDNDKKAKASDWNDLQVRAYDAEQTGRHAEAAEHRAAALAIENDLSAAGTNIRALVCP